MHDRWEKSAYWQKLNKNCSISLSKMLNVLSYCETASGTEDEQSASTKPFDCILLWYRLVHITAKHREASLAPDTWALFAYDWLPCNQRKVVIFSDESSPVTPKGKFQYQAKESALVAAVHKYRDSTVITIYKHTQLRLASHYSSFSDVYRRRSDGHFAKRNNLALAFAIVQSL